MNEILLTIAIVIILAMGTHILVNAQDESDQTCESVRTELWAYGQCLKFRPACPINTDSFIRMHELKEIVKQCPENDGDDLQSYLNKSK